jgi:hypothetical protein
MNIVSLLQRLKSNQVDDLIVEEDLKKKNYHFFYTIDNNEIHKYCFPGNLDGKNFEKSDNEEINFDLESDIVTAYEEFFQSISKETPVFFLDEYIGELLGLRDQIILRIKRSDLFNYVETFNEYLDKLARDRDIIEDFTLFIAIATGILKNGAQRYNSIIKHPYFLTKEEQLLDIKNGAIFKDAFQSNSKLDFELVDKIFETFIDLKGAKNRLSKRVDSAAISRLISINDYLENSERKIVLLFLSTSTNTRQVFEKIDTFLPIINGRPINFHRTVEQLFLNRLLNDLKSEERTERLIKIRELIDTREASKEYDEETKKRTEALEKNLEQSFKNIRDNYVNTNLARKEQFEKTEKLFQALNKAQTNMSKRQLEKLFKDLKNLSQEYKDEESNLEALKLVETAFHIGQIFLSSFKKAIYLLETGRNLSVSRGKDKIAGRGQHLPVVFNSSSEATGETFDNIAELYLNQFAFTQHAKPNPELLNQLVKLASSTTSATINEYTSSSIEDKMLFCLYSLILPDVNPTLSNSELVEEVLIDIYQIAKTNTPTIFANLLYILSWVLRRNKKFTRALEYAEEGIKDFPEDARFYHSRFLINACLEDELKTKKELIASYENQISDIHQARRFYDSILASKSEIIRLNTDITLLNSELFMHLLLMQQTDGLEPSEKRKQLKNFRSSFLEVLKTRCDSSYTKYTEYPEFQHTEVILEQLESESEEDIQKKKAKLKNAIRTLESAIVTAKGLENFKIEEYEKLLEQLKEKLSSLQEQIS